MKDYEKIIKGLEACALHDSLEGCKECPYCEHCDDLVKDALALIKELIERPVPNYELTFKAYDEDIRKLNDQLCCVTMERDRACADLAEAQRELTALRAIKATAEAFWGVKIDGYIK